MYSFLSRLCILPSFLLLRVNREARRTQIFEDCKIIALPTPPHFRRAGGLLNHLPQPIIQTVHTYRHVHVVIIIRGKESSETICKAIQQKFLFCQMSTRSRRFSKLRIYSLSHVSFNQSTPQSNSTAQDTFPHNKDLYSNEVAHIKSSHK